MVNSRSILFSGIALCVAGCSSIPFFSTDATPRNPVPKPDWEQSHEGTETKSKQDAGGEKKRTPSVVWLPESQVRARSIASNQNRITDGTGQPILTALSECVRPGYSLLDGTECGADPDSRVDAETISGTTPNVGDESSLLGSDLLGGTPQPISQKILPPASKIIDSSQAIEQSPGITRVSELRGDRTNAPKIVQAAMTPAHPIPARYERIVLSSDLVFEFAKSGLEGLSTAGQDALRGLRERFGKYDPTSFRKVVITGHADRLGKPKSNVAISLKRASAIKSFLISTGIDPDILEAVGVGSVSPVAHCTAKDKSAKLKSCLAPNRRVEIEIIGAT